MNKTEIEMAELKKQIEVMEAHLAGMPIQWGTGEGWHDLLAEHPSWDWVFVDYRVKPEAKQKTLWINIYPSDAKSHTTKEEAEQQRAARCVACLPHTFTYTEGEGL